MNNTYLDIVAAAGAAVISHIGLVDQDGNELAGGSPAYARQAVFWNAPIAGFVQPAADLDFNVPGGVIVAGWRGYSAVDSGTDYGGADLTPESYSGQGTYKLFAAGTGIDHEAGD